MMGEDAQGSGSEGGAPLVRFDNVTKRFGALAAVEELSLDIGGSEFFALLGPSGCGKTTLLRMLAGFEAPDEGRVLLAGDDLAAVPPYRRPVNMMFQNYALFPHLTVAGNVAFGLKQERLPGLEIATRVQAMLAMVKLGALADRKPDQLSGGQRQRVALARALVKRPKVLLLDEPLAALDRKLREEMRFELMELRARLGLTFVIVTHDREEAMTVAHRIGVMDRGRLVQVASPAEIYEQPGSRFIADFIGDVNLIEGRLAAAERGRVTIATVAGELVAGEAAGAAPGDTVWLAVRPEKVRIARENITADNNLSGTVAEIAYLGDLSIYKVKLDSGLILKAAAANMTRLAGRTIGAGDRVRLSWPAEAGVVLTR